MTHQQDWGTFDGMAYGFGHFEKIQRIWHGSIEILNVMVALKIWDQIWSRSHIRIHCDNLAVMKVLNSSKTKGIVLGPCARNVNCHI